MILIFFLSSLSTVMSNGGLCTTLPSGTALAQWNFSPGFSNVSNAPIGSPVVPANTMLVASKTVDIGAVRVTTCANVMASSGRVALTPELELAKSSVLIQVVMATTSRVTSGTVLAAGYVPSTMNVQLDHAKLRLAHTNLITEVRSQASEVVLEPDDFRLVSLYLDATQALLFLDNALVSRLPWDFAGVGGVGGDSSLAVQFGPLSDLAIAEPAGMATADQPFLLHTVRFSCLEAPPTYSVADVLALLEPARRDCHRLRSPITGVAQSPATGTPSARPGTIDDGATATPRGTGATDDDGAQAPGARPAVPGWLIGVIVGVSALVLVVGCVAAYIVARKVRRNRMDEVQRAIEMERKSVRRQPSVGSALSTMTARSTASAGSAPPSHKNTAVLHHGGASHTYAGPSDTVDLTEALNDDKQQRHFANEQAPW
jgi:hypothetical protein